MSILRHLRVIPALVAGIQRAACSAVRGWLDAGDEPRHDGRCVLSIDIAVALLTLLLAGSPLRAAELELPVPRITIYPGDVIADDQLMGRAFIAHTVARASVLDSREALVGKVARRTLLPGQPIPVGGVREPYVVNQGKSALVVFEAGGLTITTSALALQNGGVGDLVSLRNLDSGTVIKGTVAADGTVRVAVP